MCIAGLPSPYPSPSSKQILGYVQSGVAEGARLECGGGRHGEKGFFVQPTVLSGVTDDMVVAREEIFGPVQVGGRPSLPLMTGRGEPRSSTITATPRPPFLHPLPLQCILSYKTLEEAIRRANGNQFGLAAGIVTRDVDRALTTAHALQAGQIWINTYHHFDAAAP